ncbi:glycoside hydrolase family 2 protein [Stipitochalara longipes BDJ]|nr:glycoside hydrolase family 2 protein [Stipitochalara longipes BDJ]
MAPLQKVPVDKGWSFRQTTTLANNTATSYLPVSQFPTVAHLDLLHHGLIKDPYIDTNELDSLWVNDADFTYRTLLPPLPALSPSSSPSSQVKEAGKKVELVFEGLDTICSVFLNDELILESVNMHISHRVDVTEILQKNEGKEIELRLEFKNAPAYAKKEMKRIGYKGNGIDVHFGGPERLFVRKAQYHWGWDWGPALNTSGPWKPIYLEVFEARISEFLIRQEVSDDLETAIVKISGSVEGADAGKEVVLEILSPSGENVKKESVKIDENGTFKAELNIQKPELWYPFTYGSQPLYTISTSLPGLDTQERKIGFRRLRLLQHPLKHAEGTSFTFSLNNIRIFSGGSCWIPGDFLLPRFTASHYRSWLSLAKSGNQTMIRVWGGGIVESDSFYEICDELGILVWQDFLFACGDYPASDDFVEKVRGEAEQQVKRVGHHASLVLWAGNNEDYMLAERRGLGIRRTFLRARFMRGCFRRYVRGWRETTHIWDVWHGKQSPYQAYKAYLSRFISEFGFESAPSLRTLHQAITTPSERHWQSLTFDAHDKGPGHQRRYGMYSGENFRFRFNPLRDFVYCSQFLQAEAMKYAYNHWRREFRGEGEENCSGILVWQLNDIWPGTSWALVDVNLQRKPAFYITKRALGKVVVGMERVVTGQVPYMVTSYPEPRERVGIWAVSSYLSELSAVLRLKAFDIESGDEVTLPEEEKERKVTLKANGTTEIGDLAIPSAGSTVIVAYLSDEKTDELLARWVDWPEPLKFVVFKKGVEVKIDVADGEKEVKISANAPVKGVVLGGKSGV